MNSEIISKITELKKKKNAIILAHNYQSPDIQDIADFIGDSLELARISSQVKEDIIIFCGVFFMAETANILAPHKKVILPVPDADCPMARMVDKSLVIETKKKYPDATVVTYVNSTADVKALTDICCTSSNAIKVVNSVETDKIIFLPDKNLGRNIARFVPKEFIFIEGYCPVHNFIYENEIKSAKERYPDAEVIMHPEVEPLIARYADKLLSTGGMIKYAKTVRNRKMIIVTEEGLIYRLRKDAPYNEYYNIGRDIVCQNMKKIRLIDVLNSLENEGPVIKVDDEIRVKAYNSIERMLKL
ncbi:MAG TPA: quinolinate synthase NadA [Spirochaetota bacterium]|nr:quinolinate synthase NadA [Spirochaetota bacterium]HOM38844.1 quinolinate synthase NadA [Spirochaetota bacterium]HPQ49139.1 quinolinate synthase NadA [Spirochaetota bacterium]